MALSSTMSMPGDVDMSPHPTFAHSVLAPESEAALSYINNPYVATGSASPSWLGYESQAECMMSLDHNTAQFSPSYPSIDQPTYCPSLPGAQTFTSQYITSSLPPPHNLTSTSDIGPDNRRLFGTYYAPKTPSHRRRRAARAIQFDGRWVDEEELLWGLCTPDATISVHKCRWDEQRSPCDLWVVGDKSCMNTHIQRWHGGKPGGDKLETDCRWSNCHKRMNKESIARHVVTIHLGEKWWCQGCSDEIVRKDAYDRHVERSSTQACRDAGAFVKYDAQGYVIDCHLVLNSGGKVRYAL
ncbi:hypothetical protein F5I97DRAFT_1904558 [Phlebopus sp. FC_14]|nr:hypothetical protein F5I97DRAFT_1904558 [Phlebopus sp. FC_14]